MVLYEDVSMLCHIIHRLIGMLVCTRGSYVYTICTYRPSVPIDGHCLCPFALKAKEPRLASLLLRFATEKPIE
jgi:hypothetical protein